MDKNKYLRKYENSNLRNLSQYFGLTSVIDSFVIKRISDIKEKRFLMFIDSLDDGFIKIDDEDLKSDEFINKFLLTSKAVINSRKVEKQEMFIRLFKNSEKHDDFKIDDFEELHIILESLSYRELIILMTLKKFEDECNSDANDVEKKFAIANEFWSKFMVEVQNELDLKEDTLVSHLTRLNRTGLFRTYNGFWTSNDIVGRTTQLFDELLSALN